jgi:hypothetical protein
VPLRNANGIFTKSILQARSAGTVVIAGVIQARLKTNVQKKRVACLRATRN